jgi:hypothetical protein
MNSEAPYAAGRQFILNFVLAHADGRIEDLQLTHAETTQAWLRQGYRSSGGWGGYIESGRRRNQHPYLRLDGDLVELSRAGHKAIRDWLAA